ncbi:MAG: NAD(P)/FAD-dependent oxidoreductase [Candidatus Omnitrophica bacterium]|nr:NAD(P)/FAD-dependent oxidoreductase [Candidatus Omnitrophota bacterium]
MEYDAAVIGSGVGGLICAFQLARQGKSVVLCEAQAVPGGYATTFTRNGFIFESAVHCVDDLGKDGDIRNFLEETGLIDKITLLELKNFARTVYPEHDFIVDFKRENFIDFLRVHFPHEQENIDAVFKTTDRFYAQFDRFVESSLPDWLESLLIPFLCPSFIGVSRVTVQQFFAKYFKDEKLIALFGDLWHFLGLPPSRLSMFFFLLAFRGYYANPTAYVKGGFCKLFKVLVEELKNSGATVHFNTAVRKIVTSKGKKVIGIETDKGEIIKAKAIVSNANAIDTLTRLLDDDRVRKEYALEFSSMEKSLSGVQVYLGLKVPAKNLGMTTPMLFSSSTYDHDANFSYIVCGDYDRCFFEMVDHSQIDSSLAPAGKGTLTIMVLDLYKNWRDLSREEYREKKQAIAQKLIRRAEKYLPGLSEVIEVMEVATPRTMQRYTASPEGAIYGFAPTVSQSGMNRLPQTTKVKGLFLTGAWTQPGHGVHACFLSGLMAGEEVMKFLG